RADLATLVALADGSPGQIPRRLPGKNGSRSGATEASGRGRLHLDPRCLRWRSPCDRPTGKRACDATAGMADFCLHHPRHRICFVAPTFWPDAGLLYAARLSLCPATVSESIASAYAGAG